MSLKKRSVDMYHASTIIDVRAFLTVLAHAIDMLSLRGVTVMLLWIQGYTSSPVADLTTKASKGDVSAMIDLGKSLCFHS